MLFCRTDAFDDVSSLSLFRFSIGNEHLCQSCKTLLRFKSNHFQATVHLFNFFIMIETVCSALNNTQKMFLFFWSWLADKLHFILNYEYGFFKPTILKLHPPLCRITASARVPGYHFPTISAFMLWSNLIVHDKWSLQWGWDLNHDLLYVGLVTYQFTTVSCQKMWLEFLISYYLT